MNVHVSSLLSTKVPSPDKTFKLETIKGSPSGSLEFARRFSKLKVIEVSSSIEPRFTGPVTRGGEFISETSRILKVFDVDKDPPSSSKTS